MPKDILRQIYCRTRNIAFFYPQLWIQVSLKKVYKNPISEEVNLENNCTCKNKINFHTPKTGCSVTIVISGHRNRLYTCLINMWQFYRLRTAELVWNFFNQSLATCLSELSSVRQPISDQHSQASANSKWTHSNDSGSVSTKQPGASFYR